MEVTHCPVNSEEDDINATRIPEMTQIHKIKAVTTATIAWPSPESASPMAHVYCWPRLWGHERHWNPHSHACNQEDDHPISNSLNPDVTLFFLKALELNTNFAASRCCKNHCCPIWDRSAMKMEVRSVWSCCIELVSPLLFVSADTSTFELTPY